jgi:serine/threonine-protein kinase RsbW
MDGQGCCWRTTLPARIEAVDAAVSEFNHLGIRHESRARAFAQELLLREALTNAVLHGSGQDPAKLVRCVARWRGQRLLVVVEDEGEGWDWRAAWERPVDDASDSGRGLFILRSYARRVRFNRKGNLVAFWTKG